MTTRSESQQPPRSDKGAKANNLQEATRERSQQLPRSDKGAKPTTFKKRQGAKANNPQEATRERSQQPPTSDKGAKPTTPNKRQGSESQQLSRSDKGAIRLALQSDKNQIVYKRKSENMIEVANIFWESVLVILFCLICTAEQDSVRKLPRKKESFFGYRLIYADQKKTESNPDFGRLLYSAKYDIQGKPDYIYCRFITDRLMPVELKSGTIGDRPLPHEGDYLQLCAYFLIIEDVYKRRPKYGQLCYQDAVFVVKNTRKVRKRVLRVVKKMQEMLESGEAKANASYPVCRNCICRDTVCEYCRK